MLLWYILCPRSRSLYPLMCPLNRTYTDTHKWRWGMSLLPYLLLLWQQTLLLCGSAVCPTVKEQNTFGSKKLQNTHAPPRYFLLNFSLNRTQGQISPYGAISKSFSVCVHSCSLITKPPAAASPNLPNLHGQNLYTSHITTKARG